MRRRVALQQRQQALIRRYKTQTTVAARPIQPMKIYTASALIAIHSSAHQSVRSNQSKCAA